VTSAGASSRKRNSDRLTATALAGIIVAMLGLTAASVPLYALFCKVTGYGGTTRVADEVAAAGGGAVEVVVAFNADRDPKLPWTFRPLQREVRTRLGEEHLAFYEAINRSDRPIVGRAVYNVTPHKVGSHFAKLECFCFQEQVLQPGERVEMPVSFFVDPALLDDPDAREVRQITLSYTFFVDEAATAELARKRDAGVPSAG
jgi:cytochrome c oxidase assembly protein subunit 11